MIGRREFLKRGVIAGVGVSLMPLAGTACASVDKLKRLNHPEWFEFVEPARRKGKISSTRMSVEAVNRAQCLDYAIYSGHLDVILCADIFVQEPRFYQFFLSRFDFVAVQLDLP